MESPEETMSTCSDLSESIISSVSGVGGYQEELEELRHLINPLKYLQTSQRNCRTPTQDFHHLPDNDRIKELSGQLHNALSLNEKYKSDLYNLEKKLELSYYDKIDGLIRKNKQLELQVENSNGQIERLIKNFGNVKSNLTCSKCLQLEKLNFELNTQVLSLKDELVYCKSVHNKVSDENRQLSIEIQDIKPLIDIKNVCIKDLKGKISEQHVEIQNHIRDLDVLNGSINSLRNDLSHTKKSEEWYKEQLHVCQKEKCLLTDDVLKWRATATAYNKDVEHYKIELNNLRIKYNDLELKCLRDKEKLTRFVPMIVGTKQFTQSSNDITTNKSLADYYEKTIEDLYCEINRVKDSIQQKDATYSNIAGENSQLTSQCLMLQKSIQLNESHLEDQNILIKDLQRKLILETNNTNDKTQQLMDLKVKLQKIQVELTARNQEKLMVESTIETIRQQFTLLKNNYEHLKCDLNDKNKEIMHLQTEKQELFMNNNWNVCELEKVREQVLMIKKLQEIIQKYEGELGTVQKSIEDYEQKIKVLNNNILEQQQGFALEKDGLKHQYDNNILNYDKIIIQYKDLVQTNDVKIADMHQRIEENDSVVAQLKDNIEILKTRIKQQDAELCKLKRDHEQKLSNLESHNKSLLSDNKKLQECYNNYILDFQDDSGISDGFTEDAAGDCKVEESARVGLRRKISDLQSGVSVLQTKTDRTYANLQKFSSMRGQQDDGGLNDSDEIKNLKALLKLKELERKEKQKKYEHNYRTLLRKVKEHMKGRNLAEKQNATLQTLYNTLADDNNKLKLDLSSKDYEIGNVKKLLDDYASINKKLKQSLANIEQELENKQFCKQCIEYEINLKKLSDLEIHIGNFQKENGIVQEELLKKTELVNGLKGRILELTQINDDLQVDGNKNRDKVANLAVENSELNKKLIHLEKKEEETKKLMMEVTQLELQIKNVNNDRQQINAHLQDVTEKYDFISEAIKVLSCQLHKKDEDIKQLENGKVQLQETSAKKDLEFTGLIEKLKKHIQQQESELESNKTEKYFLQRLCNDLKIALQSNVSQNKSLKQHLGKLMKGPEEYNSLPMFLPEMPSNKYDDKYINDLLQQNKAPLQDKPLIEIKGCLDSLKNEIANLQDHISKKNLST